MSGPPLIPSSCVRRHLQGRCFTVPFGLIAAGQATIEVERSRFHALALPVSSHETFLDDLARRREAIREASHHVWAWRMGPASHRYSDDGEPRGTGGRPLLDLLERRNLVGVGIIVSRIFGGRLLGRPRLLRTFAHAGLIALNAAPLARCRSPPPISLGA